MVITCPASLCNRGSLLQAAAEVKMPHGFTDGLWKSKCAFKLGLKVQALVVKPHHNEKTYLSPHFSLLPVCSGWSAIIVYLLISQFLALTSYLCCHSETHSPLDVCFQHPFLNRKVTVGPSWIAMKLLQLGMCCRMIWFWGSWSLCVLSKIDWRKSHQAVDALTEGFAPVWSGTRWPESYFGYARWDLKSYCL